MPRRSAFGSGFLLPEEGRRNDGNAVLASIRLGPGGDDHGVEQVVTDLVAQPEEVANVAVDDCPLEFDLEREHAPVVAFHDQIDLVLAAMGPQVPDGRLGCLGVRPHTERDERLEQLAEECSVPWRRRTSRTALQQGVHSDAEQSGRQGTMSNATSA